MTPKNAPAVVIYHILPQFFAKFSQNEFLIEELALVSMFKVFCDSLSHVSWKLTISHIFFYLFHLLKKTQKKETNTVWVLTKTLTLHNTHSYLFSVLPSTRIQTLN